MSVRIRISYEHPEELERILQKLAPGNTGGDKSRVFSQNSKGTKQSELIKTYDSAGDFP